MTAEDGGEDETEGEGEKEEMTLILKVLTLIKTEMCVFFFSPKTRSDVFKKKNPLNFQILVS